MTDIITWLLFFLTFIVGYLTGKNSRNLPKSFSADQTVVHNGKEMIKAYLKQKSKPGIVTSPTQQDIFLKENPKVKESIDEQKKAFGALQVGDRDLGGRGGDGTMEVGGLSYHSGRVSKDGSQ